MAEDFAWTYIHEREPKGRFVAIYDDGSGAGLFLTTEDGSYQNVDGDILTDLDNFMSWAPLPDGFMLWFEAANG